MFFYHQENKLLVHFLSGALIKLNIKAKSWLNWQIPILTDGEHSNARIINMNVEKINKYLDENGVAIIPGFQGISKNGDITTIGRGGSDATAVAVAKIFNADTCEIYTDVDGVYSTDPNKIPVAKKIDKISYDEMLRIIIFRSKSNAIICCSNSYDVRYTSRGKINFY